jgi:TatD DNase family protein
MLIDTHCHLNNERLRDDVPGCLERAFAAGVERAVVVGCDLPTTEEAVAQAHNYASAVFAVIGVHPHEARHWNDETARRLTDLAADPRVIAIGEIGLDYHYDFSSREDQERAFRNQLALAQAVNLPVVIHCREAYKDTLDILEAAGATSGVMHCWAGTEEEADRTVGLGFALGFGGTLTFKNAEETRRCAARVPLDRLLVETDAPYLAPTPHRGKRNEPAYTRLVAERLAELRGMTYEQMAELTTANAFHIFPRLASVAL